MTDDLLADLPLFSAPAQRHSPTSVAAAASLDSDTLNALHRRVLEYLAAHGPSTDEQIAIGLSMNPSTARPAWERRRAGEKLWCGKQR